MTVVVQPKYGGPDVLRLADRPIPTPRGDEVLVKVRAASVNAGDRHLLRGTPFLVRLMLGGIFRPAHKGLGVDVAGRVEAVGPDAGRFRPGDAVFGDLSGHGFGGFAEYVCVSERAFVTKPPALSYEAAATIPVAGVTALQALRDEGQVRTGDAVLINGASGGVGTFAVQIAKAFGAVVTGVCSPGKADLVRSIGADYVVDYTREDVTRHGRCYDLILDTAAHRSPLSYRRVLTPDGTYVMVGGSTARLFQVLLLGPVVSRIGARTLTSLMATANPEDLRVVADLIEAGSVAPVVDRCFPLSAVPEALHYLEAGRARGKVVITV
jgi:NADPH:quinone reductase-like Zn-dependent oxidoreductase